MARSGASSTDTWARCGSTILAPSARWSVWLSPCEPIQPGTPSGMLGKPACSSDSEFESLLIRGPGWRIGVEGETVLDDIQAVERRVALKRRDGNVDHVILLVADTPRNRRALAAAPAAFGDLPLRTREILAALRDGRDPGGSGIVIL